MRKNGQELWHNENLDGIWATKLFFYTGLYTWTTEDGHSVLNLQGSTKAVVILQEVQAFLFYFFSFFSPHSFFLQYRDETIQLFRFRV